MNVRYPLIRQFVNSPYLDVFGAALILFISIAKNFQGTMYFKGEILFDIPLNEISSNISQGAFPLGFVSIFVAVFSMLSVRFIGKQKNLGNIIGIFTTVLAGSIDYLFGNASAIITYPLTFIIMNFAAYNWGKGEVIRKIDIRYYLINGIGLIVAFGLVYLGAYLFGGRTDSIFLNTVALTFGLSIGGNLCSALKYEETWLSWMIYNVVQLTKAFLQLNFANVAKYVFYMINAVITLFDWKYNGDKTIQSEIGIYPANV